ncbi:hypothetical protein ACFL52_01840 [Candidatus Margulisiibacteriota bacterium]
MQNQVNNNQNAIGNNQGDAMAASSAMIVSGLEKELKTNKANITINDPKVNLKDLDEYLKKLTNTTQVDRIKKKEEKKGRKQEEETEQKRHRSFRMSGSGKGKAKAFEWRTSNRVSGNFFLDLFANYQRKVLENVVNYALQNGIEELVRSAKEAKMDLAGFDLEKIRLNNKKNLVFMSDLTAEERKILYLTDELKLLQIGKYLEDDWIKYFIINIRSQVVANTLMDLNVEELTIEKILTQAKQISWLKLIHELKAAHLKRIFSGSQKDFDYYTRVIDYYTQKMRKIDLEKPEAELNMIHSKLAEVAYETAGYKLGLLKSIQTLTFDKKREKDIKWLESTLKHLKHA